jgi:hypothetical protein
LTIFIENHKYYKKILIYIYIYIWEPEKFNTLLFYLISLNLKKNLFEKTPRLSDNKFDSTILASVDIWNHLEIFELIIWCI